MSTKIYEAYRIRDNAKSWALLMDLKKKAQGRAQNVIREIRDETESELKKRGGPKTKKGAAYSEARGLRKSEDVNIWIKRRYGETLAKAELSEFCFDVSLSVWKHGKHLYLLPVCEWPMKEAVDFLGEDKRLEDYSYWNNTDKPDEIPSREWNRRRKVWDAIYDRGWGNHLRLNIVSFADWGEVDPWFQDLLKGFKRERKTGKG